MIKKIIEKFQREIYLEQEEIRYLITQFQKSELYNKEVESPLPHLEWVVKILAEYIVLEFMQENLDPGTKLTLKDKEKAIIWGTALALGWTPIDRTQPLCSKDAFYKLCDMINLPLDTEENIRIFHQAPSFTLLGLLNGMDIPAIDSPFIHVWFYRNRRDKSIEEVVSIGKGIGAVREHFQEIAYTTALAISSGGCSMVADGFIYLRRTQVTNTPIVRQPLANLDIPNALLFFYQTLQSIASKSKMVRIFEVDEEKFQCFRAKIGNLVNSKETCLLTEKEKNLGFCCPIPSHDKRAAISLFVPLMVTESSFYKEIVAPFKESLIRELKEGLQRRHRFHTTECTENWNKLSFYQYAVRDFCQKVIECYQSFCIPSQESPEPPEPFNMVNQADQLSKIFTKFQEFSTYLSTLKNFIGGNPASHKPYQEALMALEKVEEFNLKDVELTALIDFDACRIVHLRERKFMKGAEFYNDNLPHLIRKHTEWCTRLQRLLKDIEIAEQSSTMKEWLSTLVFNMILRQQTLWLGDQILPQLDIFKKRVRPLLLFQWYQALQDLGETNAPLETSNIVFRISFKHEKNILMGLEITPWYFFHSLSSLFLLPQKGICALVDTLNTPYVSKNPAAIQDVFREVDVYLQNRDIERLLEVLCYNPEEMVRKLCSHRQQKGQCTQETTKQSPQNTGPQNTDQKFVSIFLLERVYNLQECYAHPAALFLLSLALDAGLKGKTPYNLPNNQLPEILFAFLNCLGLCAMLASDRRGNVQEMLLGWLNYSSQTNTLNITPGAIGKSLGGSVNSRLIENWVQKCLDLDKKWNGGKPSLYNFLVNPHIAGSDTRINLYQKVHDLSQPEYKEFREAIVDRIVQPMLPSFQQLGQIVNHWTKSKGNTPLTIVQTIIEPMANLMREFGQNQEQSFTILLDLLLEAQHKVGKVVINRF